MKPPAITGPVPSLGPPRPPARRGLSLQLKLTVALVLLVLSPLFVSIYLIDQVGKVAANFNANEAHARIAPMERAIESYRELVETTKRLHAEVATRLAADPRLAGAPSEAVLDEVMQREPGLHRLELLDGSGARVHGVSRPLPGAAWRELEVEQPLGAQTLRLGFAVSATLQDDRQKLKDAIDTSHQVAVMRSALPSGYRKTFIVLVGIAALGAAAIGIIAATLVTRRIAVLVKTTRKISEGQLGARVQLRGRDEMAELADSFNTMLDDLETKRQQIEYLQRISAWEDVARRLAHEIKNPLTPIQLAVQQCVQSYKGDDVRFRRTLTDTGEIVEEEIASLKRLVDTFRTLGQLPKVEPTPLAFGDVVGDLLLDPSFVDKLTIATASPAVTVSGDKLLLRRVLSNLVENGIHAGQEAGKPGAVRISWALRQRGQKVVIAVDDEGPGVPADKRDTIFEPYVTTKATGTGLGLAIAKKIVLEHGGDLAIAPAAAPTGGARFELTLPIARDPGQSM